MTRTFTSIIGMAPNPFYGTATEDVNVFVDEARRASTHNKWGNGSAAVCRLAYFLQGNAQYAFDAEVMDRVARKESDRRARQRRGAVGAAAGASIGAMDDVNALLVERAAAREETLTTMLEPKRRILHTWEKSREKARTGLREERRAMDDLHAQTGQLLQEFVDLEGARAQDDRKPAVADGKGAPSKFDFSGLTDAQMDDRRNAISRQLAALQAQMDTKREVINDMQAREESLAQQVDDARKLYEVARIAADQLLAAQEEEEGGEAGAGTDDVARAFPTLEGFFAWLQQMFERKDVIHSYMAEFYRRKLKRGEKVQDYALEMMRLSKRSGMCIGEEERSRYFVEGLNKTMRRHIKRQWDSEGTPQSQRYRWNQVLEIAKRLERDVPALCAGAPGDYDDAEEAAVYSAAQSVSHQGEGASVMAAQSEAAGGQAELLAAIKEMMTTIVEQVRGGRPPRRNACYNCGKTGHISRNCPDPPTQVTQEYRNGERSGRGRRRPQCYACGEFGHYAPDCPNGNRIARPVSCYACGQQGHLARDCPQAATNAQASTNAQAAANAQAATATDAQDAQRSGAVGQQGNGKRT